MADTKLSDLTENTNLGDNDLIPVVSDPLGSPITQVFKKTTLFTSPTITTPTITTPVISLGSDANGDMYYRASGVLTRLAKGTNGQMLSTNGSIPVWENKQKEATFIVGASGSDYTDIQDAIDALPVGGGSIYIKEGTYVISAPITLISNLKIQGAGVGNTIIQQASGINDNVIYIETLTNITIRDLSIDGNVSNNATGDNGIAIVDSSNILIENVESYNNKLKGFVIATGSADTTDITFLNCEAHDNSQDGITMASSTTNYARRITVQNCYCHDNTQYGIGIVTPDTTYLAVQSATIIGNRVYNNGTYGIEISGSKGTRVIGNILDDNGYHGIDMGSTTDAAYKVYNAIIMGNTVKNSSDNGANYVGIRLQSCANCIVTANRCYDDQVSKTQDYGISANGLNASNCKIYGNDCEGNASSDAELYGATLPTISGATPSIAGASVFFVTNGGATTMTNLTNGSVGTIVTLIFTDSNTSIGDSGSFALTGAFSSTANDTLRLVSDGSTWYEIGRSAN